MTTTLQIQDHKLEITLPWYKYLLQCLTLWSVLWELRAKNICQKNQPSMPIITMNSFEMCQSWNEYVKICEFSAEIQNTCINNGTPVDHVVKNCIMMYSCEWKNNMWLQKNCSVWTIVLKAAILGATNRIQ